MSFIAILFIGLIAGWLASLIMKGRGLGVIGDIAIGVVGALIGGLLFGSLGASPDSLIGQIIAATIGAVIFLFLVGFVKRTT